MIGGGNPPRQQRDINGGEAVPCLASASGLFTPFLEYQKGNMLLELQIVNPSTEKSSFLSICKRHWTARLHVLERVQI